MTTPALYPTLPGLAWSVFKRPTWSTNVATHVSGREVRAANWAFPLYEFELNYDQGNGGFLRADGSQELQTLMGFYLRAQGQFATFRFIDPTDSIASAGVIGTGDGSTTSFTFLRDLGGWVEPVGWVEAVSAVHVGGVALGSGWSLVSPNTLQLSSPPASGVQVTADFSFSFLCRFLDDKHEYENFMDRLWSNSSVKFRSVRP